MVYDNQTIVSKPCFFNQSVFFRPAVIRIWWLPPPPPVGSNTRRREWVTEFKGHRQGHAPRQPLGKGPVTATN